MLDLKTTVVPVSTMAHVYESIFLLEKRAIVGQVFQEGKWEKVECFDAWCEVCYKKEYGGDDVAYFMKKISSQTITEALRTEDEYTVEFSLVLDEAEHRKCLKAFLCEDDCICICVKDITVEYRKEQSRERIAGDCIEMAQQAILAMERLWENINENLQLPAAQAVAILETGLQKEQEEAKKYTEEAIKMLQKYEDTLEGVFWLSQLEKGIEIQRDDIVFVSDLAADIVKTAQMQTGRSVDEVEIKEKLKKVNGVISNRLCLKHITANAFSIMILNSKEHSVHAVLDYEDEKEALTLTVCAQETDAMFIKNTSMQFVQRLVGYMQGELLFGTEGDTTKLSILIPVKNADKETLRNAKTMARMRNSIDDKDFAAFRALVVDDDSICREIIVSKLKQFGLTVETAEDGAEAMEKLSASPGRYYQIIFTKMMLPKKSGLDMTMELRELKRRDLNDITIVAVTMNPEADRRLIALEHGMDYHLVLPFNDLELNEILLRELENIGPEEANEKFGFRIIK